MSDRDLSDRYARIRTALAMDPTPGPWDIEMLSPDLQREGSYRCAVSRDGVGRWIAKITHEANGGGGAANSAFIAACDPDTVRALLAERDALREVLGRILENEASDWKAAEEFGGYVLDDELREEARAALGQEAGRG
jgi:hypothetical protein